MMRVKIFPDQIGLAFRDGTFKKVLRAGTYWNLPFSKTKIEVCQLRDVIFTHPKLRDLAKSGSLKELGEILDLKDDQRALIWVDGRFHKILPPGHYIIWNVFAEIRIDIVDARSAPFQHGQLSVISRAESSLLEIQTVHRDHEGILFVDGNFTPSCNQVDMRSGEKWLTSKSLKSTSVNKRSMSTDKT